MKKALGFLFALALFFLPIAWGVHAEDVISQDQISTSSDTTSSQAVPISFFRSFVMRHFMNDAQESQLDKTNAEITKSKLSFIRDKFQNLLRRLNNTQ